jgi:hypothetical protein
MDALEAVKSLADRIQAVTGLSRSTLVACFILVVGWAGAFVLRWLAERLVDKVMRLFPAAAERPAAGERRRARVVIGRVVFWATLLLVVMTATELVGLPVITSWLSGVASYLPRLFAALIVFALGMGSGRIARRAVARAAASGGVTYADRLGRMTEVAVVLVSVLVAMEQLGMELSFVTSAVMIVLGSSLGAAALAFGLGSRSVVENILSGHYVRKLYEVGHVVRIDGVEGRILRMTPTAVILQAKEGEVAVPTQEFTRARSTLVARGG